MVYSWFALALILAILEMVFPGLFLFLSFSLGAIVAGIASIWIESIVVQSLFFLGGTLVALFGLRYWIKTQFKAPEITKETQLPSPVQEKSTEKKSKERKRKEKEPKTIIREVIEEQPVLEKPKEKGVAKEPSKVLSNVYALKGQKGIVLKAVTPKSTGVVKIGGEVWSARTAREDVIQVGTMVEVIDVIGVHLIVERVS
jgi:membrane protein implicated in regulation of membrane protease activity